MGDPPADPPPVPAWLWVYRAEDLALERPVAIKMLRPDLAEDRAFVEHLRIEAAMLARLEHPNLVQIE